MEERSFEEYTLLQPRLQSSAARIVAPAVKASVKGSLPARGMVWIPEGLTTTTTTKRAGEK